MGVCNIFFRPIEYKRRECKPDPAAAISTTGLGRYTFSRISMDQEFDAPLGDYFNYGSNAKLAAADIIVRVRYHAWLMPWTNTMEQRFYTRPQSDGQLYWLAVPPAENPAY